MIKWKTKDGTVIPPNQVYKDYEKYCFVKTFLNRYDAFGYVQEVFDEYTQDEYDIIECKVEFINNAYRVGLIFEKRQGELNV